jgi:hypothetical protein
MASIPTVALCRGGANPLSRQATFSSTAHR